MNKSICKVFRGHPRTQECQLKRHPTIHLSPYLLNRPEDKSIAQSEITVKHLSNNLLRHDRRTALSYEKIKYRTSRHICSFISEDHRSCLNFFFLFYNTGSFLFLNS